MNITELRKQLIYDEDIAFKLYKDTKDKLTIGVGRNLTDRGISEDEALLMLDNDIKIAVNALDTLQSWWRDLNDVRQNVLINMTFNMGIGRLGGFTDMIAALKVGDFERAADEMKDSNWSRQVGARADRLIARMRTGE